MNKLGLTVLGSLAFSAVASLWAENTYQWNNTTARSANFSTSSNWDGAAPANDVSTQIGDVFRFDGDLAFYQTAYQGTVAYGKFYTFGTILGTASHLLAGGANGLNARGMMVKDASLFEGSIGARTDSVIGGADWFLASTLETPAVVQNARLMYGMDLNVYNVQNATGIVQHAWGPGYWRAGAAAGYNTWATAVSNTVLRVDDLQSGPQSAAIVQNQSTLLVKGGHPETAGVVGVPAIHLDATAAASFAWADGRITSWSDVRGNGFAAVADGTNPGPVVTTDAESQLPFADFGAINNRADVKAYGAGDAGTLVFNGGDVEGICEVFIVFKDQKIHNQQPSPALDNTTLLVQNFLGNAGGESQYFSRWMMRRSGAGFYGTYLLDANTRITAASGNYVRDTGAVTTQNVTADVRINGARVMPEYTDDFSRHANVLSIGYSGGASPVHADRLACNGRGHIGGIQIGELLIYTNALTSAERREVNAYLLAKWCAASERGDLDLVAALETPDSHLKGMDGTLAVGSFEVGNESVEMDGNLRVERFSGVAPTIAFGNGASNLTVAASQAMKDIEVPSAPVGDPEIWLDANKNVTTFDTNCFGEAITYVSGWGGAFVGGTNRWGSGISCGRVGYSTTAANRYVVDCDTGLLLPAGTTARPCYPTLASAGYGDLKMVDFGPQRRDKLNINLGKTVTSNLVDGTEVQVSQVYDWQWKRARDASGFTISRTNASGTGAPPDSGSTRTAFYVLRCNNEDGDDARWPMTFGTRDACAGTDKLLATSGSGTFCGAEWRVNGQTVNPMSFAPVKGQIYVVVVRLVEPVTGLARLCYYEPGTGSGSWGGMSYGEILGYPYRLTDREVAENEAYLMNRWLGEDHPEVIAAAGQTLAGVAFADASVEASVTAEKPLSIGSLSVAGTSFAKRGSASLSVVSASRNISSFAVEGGSLAAASPDWLDDAAFHLDASDYDSFTWKDGQEGTSIVGWQDVRRNGKVATSKTAPIDDPMDHIGKSAYRNFNSGMTNAQYRVSDGSDGLLPGLGYVDCLDYKVDANYNKDTGAPSASAGQNMVILAASNDCAGLTFSSIKAREFHVVWAFNGSDRQIHVIGDSGDSLVPSGNDGSSRIFNNSKSPIAYAAKIKTDDGGWFTGVYSTNNQFRVGTGYHVQSFFFSDDVNANQLVMDRSNCARGGIRLCEVIIFAGETNTIARAEKIHAYLQKKWLGQGEGAVTGVEIANVNLKNGGTLELGSDVALEPGADISASVTAEGVSAFTVGGSLTIGAGARLTVTIDDTMSNATGEWIVLSADEIVNPENLSVNIVVDSAQAMMRSKLVWEGGKLVLKMVPSGLFIIVR